MSVQLFSESDQLASVGVEQTLVTTAASGVYVLQVDRSGMTGGDALELRIKAATRAEGDGADLGVVRYQSYADAPSDSDAANLPVVETEPFSAPFGLEATLKQTAGVAVVFPWMLKRVG